MSKIAKVVDVSECASIETMLNVAGTNWDIVKVPAKVVGPAEYGFQETNDGGFLAMVRPDTGTPLGFVSSRFRANSHRAQLQSLQSLLDCGDISPVSVSLWDNGAIQAYQFKCHDLTVAIRGYDTVSPLLTLAFSYGSQIADSAFFCDFRWFCKNQMGHVAKLNDAGSNVRHRGAVEDKFAGVLQNRIQQLDGELSHRYNSMRQMTTVELRHERLYSYIADCLGCTEEEKFNAYRLPVKDLRGQAAKVAAVLECYEVDDCGAQGTVWQAYNAITRYQTHKAGHNEASRNKRMLFGSGNEAVRTAFDLAEGLLDA